VDPRERADRLRTRRTRSPVPRSCPERGLPQPPERCVARWPGGGGNTAPLP
jgi:hypothetical protein